jgi:hypothetical protein
MAQKKMWQKCECVESEVYHAVFVNADCLYGIENDKGDYFVYKNTCNICRFIILKSANTNE